MTDHGRVIPFPTAHGRGPWLTKKQTAWHLGYSVRWVDLMVAEGMPCERIGTRLRFRIADVEAWLAERDQHRVRQPRKRSS